MVMLTFDPSSSLTEHAENKHSKGLTDCFPSFVAA